MSFSRENSSMPSEIDEFRHWRITSPRGTRESARARASAISQLPLIFRRRTAEAAGRQPSFAYAAPLHYWRRGLSRRRPPFRVAETKMRRRQTLHVTSGNIQSDQFAKRREFEKQRPVGIQLVELRLCKDKGDYRM